MENDILYWAIPLVICRIFSTTSMPTSQSGAIANLISPKIQFVFVVLSFIVGEHWWYGFVAIAAIVIPPLLFPYQLLLRISPYECKLYKLYSTIASHLNLAFLGSAYYFLLFS